MINILIVDDERLHREFIRESFDWQLYGMRISGEAANGREALRQIATNPPDVVVADIRMPGMNGLELSSQIRSDHPGISVILLTAHDEFEYARQALRLGVADFVLKPIEKEELVVALLRVRESRSETPVGPQKMDEVEQLALEKVLGDFLEGDLDPNEPHLKRYLGPLLSDVLSHSVVCVELATRAGESEHIRWKSDIGAICRSSVDQPESTLVIHGPGGRIVCIASDANPGSVDLQLHGTCERVCSLVKRKLAIELSMGIGGWQAGPTGIRESYREAVAALEHKAIFGDGQVLRFADLPALAQQLSTCPAEFHERLYVGLRGRDNEQIQETLEEAISILSSNGMTGESVHLTTLGLVSVCVSYLVELGIPIEDVYGPDFSPRRQLTTCRSMPEIAEFLRHVFEAAVTHFGEMQTSRSAELVLEAQRFIHQTYADPGLRVPDVARHVAIDPSYLRAAFRETLHTSVREFIVHTRLQHAKELLGRGENLRLSEIATMVGYDDAGYLSKSFKRHYGLSPTEYERSAQSANRKRQ